MGWNELNGQQRDTLLALFEAGDLSPNHARANGMYLKNLINQLRQYRDQRTVPRRGPGRPKGSTTKARKPVADLLFATDQERFDDELATLRRDSRIINVMHLCDIHFPQHSTPALELAYQLLGYIQPAITVVGSDAVDFSLMSTFRIDPEINAAVDDELDLFQSYWEPHIDRVCEIAPDTLKPYILGNHEQRIFDYMERQAPKLRKTVWRRFIEIVQSNGRVLWLGETDAVDIGTLRVQHGNRYGKHTAMSLLEDLGYQQSTMAGHVHRLTSATKTGALYTVQGITSGCLALKRMNYEKRKTPTSKHENGTAIAEVDLRGHDVKFDNLLFREEAGTMWTRFERQAFEVVSTIGARV